MNIIENKAESKSVCLAQTKMGHVYRGIENGEIYLGVKTDGNSSYVANLKTGKLHWAGNAEGVVNFVEIEADVVIKA